MKKFITTLLIIILAAGAGWFVYRRVLAKTLSPIAHIPVFEVLKGDFNVTVSSIGVLDAAVKKSVTAAFSGKIIKLIPEGSFVNEGDPVIWLEVTDLEDERKENEVEVELAKSELRQREDAKAVALQKNALTLQADRAKLEFQKLKVDDARINLDKQKVLVEQNLAARSTVDSARIALLQAELTLKQSEINLKKLIEDQQSDIKIRDAEVERARVNLERQQYKLDEVLEKIDKAIIKANGQGHISYSMTWKSGKMGKIAEGDQTWQRRTLMEIPDPDTMQAVIPISEIDIGKIEKGQKADITIDAISGETFQGEVEAKSIIPISEGAGPFGQSDSSTPKGKEFEVRISFSKTQDAFRQGMTARVRVYITTIPDVVHIPQEAVYSEDGKSFAFLKNDGSYEKVEIETGENNENYIIVTRGLEPGQQILLRDPTRKIEAVGAGLNTESSPDSIVAPGAN